VAPGEPPMLVWLATGWLACLAVVLELIERAPVIDDEDRQENREDDPVA
jgi:hypothetical protein